MVYLHARMLTIFTLFIACACDDRRPIYNIAHMVNCVDEIEPNLDLGANMLEADVQFHTNGSVKELHHGTPCDVGRYCECRANFRQYLEHVRNVTDPSTTPRNYAGQMIMLFLDLKLKDEIDVEKAGRDLARHVLDFLWSEDGERQQEVRVLIYINDVKYNVTIHAFTEEFKSRGKESRLKDVGFDGGSGNIEDNRKMFVSLGLGNVWIGDGNTNSISAITPDCKLREEIEIRDNPPSFIIKVYNWTIDCKIRMIRSLFLEVDAFVTNLPKVVANLVRGPFFQNSFRLATPDDNPFERYAGK